MTGEDDSFRVLHVDDDPDFASMASAHLELTDERLEIITETDATAGLDVLGEVDIDCVVSDFNMPKLNGIEFLREVRVDHPDLPFILFTGRGSEEVASEAISAGVTDYLQKETGTEQFTVLANRIHNAVEQHRAVQEVAETRTFYEEILDRSWDFVIIVDEHGVIDYVSPAVERVMGFDPAELVGTNAFDFPHPEDREAAFEALSEVIESPGKEVTVEYRAKDADGEWRWVEVRGGNLMDNPVIDGIMVNVRDVTRRKEHEISHQQQTERLQDLTRYLSHDMKNQLSIVDGHLEMVAMSHESDNLEVAIRALGRVEEMLEKIRQLAESGPEELHRMTVSLDGVVRRSWANVQHSEATLVNEVEMELSADIERLQQLFENLFMNALEHGSDDVTVTVEELRTTDNTGFAVENDGPPLSIAEPERIFESGFTTRDEGAGLGLAIVKQIVDSHGWSIDVIEPEEAGVRFEITGVEVAD